MMEMLRVSHDLNDVKKLQIMGWPTPDFCCVQTRRNNRVIIEVPKRHVSESWTYERDGDLLVCFSSLRSDPHLMVAVDPATGKKLEMIIALPANQAGKLLQVEVNL